MRHASKMPSKRPPRSRRPSPAPPFERTAVLGVVVQLRHALLEQVSDLALLQIGQRQLILGCDKSLIRDKKNPTKQGISMSEELLVTSTKKGRLLVITLGQNVLIPPKVLPRLFPFTNSALTS